MSQFKVRRRGAGLTALATAMLLLAGTGVAQAWAPAVTGTTASLAISGASFDAPTNTYSVSAGGTSSATFTIAGTGFDDASAANQLPRFIAPALCPAPAYSGAYVSVGSVDHTTSSYEWRPSGNNGSRNAGPTKWANINGSVFTNVGGRPCTPGSLIADQTLLSSDAFSTSVTLPLCWDGTRHHVKGTRLGADGRSVAYDVPSETAASGSGEWDVYGIAALATVDRTLEQITNVEVDTISTATSC
jgi:hypothetical protein